MANRIECMAYVLDAQDVPMITWQSVDGESLQENTFKLSRLCLANIETVREECCQSTCTSSIIIAKCWWANVSDIWKTTRCELITSKMAFVYSFGDPSLCSWMEHFVWNPYRILSPRSLHPAVQGTGASERMLDLVQTILTENLRRCPSDCRLWRETPLGNLHCSAQESHPFDSHLDGCIGLTGRVCKPSPLVVSTCRVGLITNKLLLFSFQHPPLAAKASGNLHRNSLNHSG